MTPARLWVYAVLAVPAATLLVLTTAHLTRAGMQAPRPASTAPMNTNLPDKTRAFLAALTPAQRTKAVFPFDAEERLNWHFVPKERRGLPLGEMDDKQRVAAKELLQTALSRPGYEKVEAIRALELVLQEIESDTEGRVRNTGFYFFTVFGEPSAKGAWALRYEGHHLSLNWTIVDGRVVASTPQFLGVNPAKVGKRTATNGPKEGTRVMPEEEDLARTLVRSLTEAQRTKGIVKDAAPNDILTGARKRTEALEDVGVTFTELDTKQRGLLLSLIQEHASVQAEAVAKKRLDDLRKSDMDGVRFAWMGGLEPGQGHYYRVQGKTFLIEYDNTQNGANHIHSVWRDFQGDFGEDALAEHYKQFPPNSAVGRAHGHDAEHSHGEGHSHSH